MPAPVPFKPLAVFAPQQIGYIQKESQIMILVVQEFTL